MDSLWKGVTQSAWEYLYYRNDEQQIEKDIIQFRMWNHFVICLTFSLGNEQIMVYGYKKNKHILQHEEAQ